MTITLNGTTGIATPDGSASIPPYTGSSGATNGMFFPTATSAAFATNGSERMRIDSSGNVGVGTTAPGAPFATGSSTDQAQLAGGLASATSALYLGTPNSSGTGAQFNIKYVRSSGATSFNLASLTSGTPTTTNLMTFSSVTGAFCMGGSPSAWGSGINAVEVPNNGMIAAQGALYILGNAYYDTAFRYTTTAVAQQYSMGSGGHNWGVAASGTAGTAITYTTAMTLTTAGNLGIGTSSPAFKVEISSAYNNGLHLKDTTGTVYGGYFVEASTMALVTRSNHGLRFGTNDATRMTIDNSGNVGIGTATPQAKLNVSNSGASGFEFYANAPGGGAGTYIQSYDRTGGAYVSTAYYATSHTFRTTSSATAMTLDSSGNLLVGTTTASARLTVLQTTVTSTLATLEGTSGAKLILDYQANGIHYADSDQFQFRTKASVFKAGISAALTGGATTLSVDASGYIIRTPSDRSLKINDEEIPYGLSDIQKMRPIIHEWTEEANMGDGKSIGFIAQEMEDIIPEVISGVDSKSLDYSKLTAVLVKAVQELAAEVESLKAKLN